MCRINSGYLFENHLKSGGVYVIEEWETAYWDDWADGATSKCRSLLREINFWEKIAYKLSYWRKSKIAKSTFGVDFILRQIKLFALSRSNFNHNFGMAGFIKELIDKCATKDFKNQKVGTDAQDATEIKEVTISHGHVFVIKANDYANWNKH